MSDSTFFHTPKHPLRVEARTPICDKRNDKADTLVGKCWGILDYVSHVWWRCRRCGAWHEVTP